MDVESLAKQLILKNMTPEQQTAVLDSIRASVSQAKDVQKQRIGENVRMVVEALKKIEADIKTRYDETGKAIEKRVASIKDGKDGRNGVDGKAGKDGRPGADGATGPRGADGLNGKDGRDGIDGVSVTDAHIDFDGSLIISLSSGRVINVGEVVAPDLAEKIKVITNGGGTSQVVIDTLASLQTQIDNLIPSQTGNSGKYLSTNGSSLSWQSIINGLSYQGTWNASTNTPTLTSSVGTNGYYYVVATAGSTNLNGITDWKIGDWLIFNGSAWQKIDQSETLQFVTSNDSSVTITTTNSTADLAVYSTPRVIAQVRNETGATLTKGTVVYISGAAGNKATVSKAIATSDSTSAQTFGVVFADISNNNNGYAILSGDLAGLDTSAFSNGTQLYLSSTTAGTYTSTKQYAPNHLVYIGVVTRSHVNQGSIEVRIQNGYEMDELHNVSAQNPTNGQVLIYNESTSLWEKNTLTDGTGISITEGAGSITITNSAPDQTVALTGAGTTSITGTYPNFTITSNDAYTGTVTSVTGTSPVASSGGTTPAISLSSGYGDTQNPYASKTANYVLAAPNGVSGVPTFRAIVASDIPTLNQNTTGTASNVTGTVAIANGGTGATTAATALSNLGAYAASNPSGYTTNTGTVTSVTAGTGLSGGTITGSGTIALANTAVTAGSYTVASITVDAQGRITSASNGSGGGTVTSVAVSGGTTGLTTSGGPVTSSGTITLAGTLAIANGGTGATTRQDAMDALAGAVTSGSYLRGNGTDVVMSAIQAGDVPTLNQNTTGTASNVTGTVAVSNGGTGGTTAALARTGIGATTLGSNLFTLTNVAAISFPRFNADNTVSSLDAATFRTAIGAGTGSGTVTGVTATAPVASSGGTAPVISLNAAYGDTTNPYASKTANNFLAAPNGSAGAPTFRAIVAADIPTLNQNTTGTASNVTGTVAVANGGTGATTLTANNVLLGNGTSAIQVVAPSTSGNVLTSNGSTWISSAAPSGGPKAWVLFDGTGTVTIRGSFNVSSITDNGNGDYTVNFTSALANANYSTVASAAFTTGGTSLICSTNSNNVGSNYVTAPTTSAMRMVVYARASGTGTDSSYISAVMFNT